MVYDFMMSMMHLPKQVCIIIQYSLCCPLVLLATVCRAPSQRGTALSSQHFHEQHPNFCLFTNLAVMKEEGDSPLNEADEAPMKGNEVTGKIKED
ncbi:hypothetical protein Y1Q_0010947 [Alligator mississippiensis]|uniref:Uncharacterized protein n=1 Tax=Alligator mississippiensis TaxID=8496 RepID=A0A151MEF2_ALLMI|nr:hypothetical protein Y1Q_0010947 [Alligator mississippiensis]